MSLPWSDTEAMAALYEAETGDKFPPRPKRAILDAVNNRWSKKGKAWIADYRAWEQRFLTWKLVKMAEAFA